MPNPLLDLIYDAIAVDFVSLVGNTVEKTGMNRYILRPVCRDFARVFNQPKLMTRKLIETVGRGDEDGVIKLELISPKYILKKGDGADVAGRKFENISPLQLACWQRD